ncbi:Putative pentatricopeptide repeat-containing protein At5g09950 [Linum grandiflorum]
MRIRDAALWNSMIAAFIEQGYHKEATDLFRIRAEEVTADATTFVIMLSSCGEAVHRLESGRILHAHALKLGIETDISVGNALLSMYADRNCIEAAKKVFSVMKEADVVSYNTMILAMASSSSKDESI